VRIDPGEERVLVAAVAAGHFAETTRKKSSMVMGRDYQKADVGPNVVVPHFPIPSYNVHAPFGFAVRYPSVVVLPPVWAAEMHQEEAVCWAVQP